MSQHEIKEEREARESRSIAPPKPEDEQLPLFSSEPEQQPQHITPPCWVELGFATFEAYMDHLDHIAQAALDGEPIPAT